MVNLSWELDALTALSCDVVGELGVECLVAGMDEVGRGALAGPVYVGVVAVGWDSLGDSDSADFPVFPVGLADSKVLTVKRREGLLPEIQRWAKDWAIGEASNTEIDELGIMNALNLAGGRALVQLDARGHLPRRLLLDGNVDYLQSRGSQDLFGEVSPIICRRAELEVETLVKGDTKSAAVAAAAILAKVYRDRFMSTLPDSGYGWSQNKGYGTPGHKSAIKSLGLSAWHRKTWKLM